MNFAFSRETWTSWGCGTDSDVPEFKSPRHQFLTGRCDSLKWTSRWILLRAVTFLLRTGVYRASAMSPSALSPVWCQCAPSLGIYTLWPSSGIIHPVAVMFLGVFISCVHRAKPLCVAGGFYTEVTRSFYDIGIYSFLSSLCPWFSSKFSSSSFIQEFSLN